MPTAMVFKIISRPLHVEPYDKDLLQPCLGSQVKTAAGDTPQPSIRWPNFFRLERWRAR